MAGYTLQHDLSQKTSPLDPVVAKMEHATTYREPQGVTPKQLDGWQNMIDVEAVVTPSRTRPKTQKNEKLD